MNFMNKISEKRTMRCTCESDCFERQGCSTNSERKCSECHKVASSRMFLNPLDKNDKLRLYKGNKLFCSSMKDPRDNIEFKIPIETYAPEYQYYSTRFSTELNIAQGPDYGRAEDMKLRIDGYGPTNV
ncbi:hypothetical protein JTE90_000322 [Oedothorax gibbosus]|uniref:Uncharacterized protein n=1 Tax=Oedothorax gibbosus TaxID=931172 RepID=A0AAV6VS33_9ARAC|nr:hypothetical protein JTE90_000322 [Oedothorax gibbosus]